MKIYLDDERATPPGFTRCWTVGEVIYLLKTRSVTHVSLDNDLGIPGKENEGYQVVRYLEDLCDERNPDGDITFPIPTLRAHSGNAAAVQDMNKGIEKLHRWKDERFPGTYDMSGFPGQYHVKSESEDVFSDLSLADLNK